MTVWLSCVVRDFHCGWSDHNNGHVLCMGLRAFVWRRRCSRCSMYVRLCTNQHTVYAKTIATCNEVRTSTVAHTHTYTHTHINDGGRRRQQRQRRWPATTEQERLTNAFGVARRYGHEHGQPNPNQARRAHRCGGGIRATRTLYALLTQTHRTIAMRGVLKCSTA